jgi:hypothetical protein
MAVTELYTFNASVSTTELSITAGGSTLQTRTTACAACVVFDLSALAKGDSFKIRVYEKARSADTQRQLTYWTVSGVQGELWTTPTFMLINGWDFSIIRTAGADRTITASVRAAS